MSSSSTTPARTRTRSIDPTVSDPAAPELLGAQMVGRWKSGAALVNTPRIDDPALGDGTPDVNDFLGQGGDVLPWRGAAPFSKRPDHKTDLTFGRFVHMQGGEYFFAPSIPALHDLPGK